MISRALTDSLFLSRAWASVLKSSRGRSLSRFPKHEWTRNISTSPWWDANATRGFPPYFFFQTALKSRWYPFMLPGGERCRESFSKTSQWLEPEWLAFNGESQSYHDGRKATDGGWANNTIIYEVLCGAVAVVARDKWRSCFWLALCKKYFNKLWASSKNINSIYVMIPEAHKNKFSLFTFV